MTPKRGKVAKTEPSNRDLSDKLDTVIEIMDTRFAAASDRVDGIDERLGTIEHRLGKVEVTMLDMQEDLTAVLTAVDKDSVTLLDHEHRITRLERK